MKVPVTVNDLLDGHVGLDIECLDRIYLNGYVANLQCEGEVASFLTRHLGNPIASPAIFEKIGTRFREEVRRFAANQGIPVIRFKKGDRKLDRMSPLLRRAATTGRSQVVAVGVAQEFQHVFTGAKRADNDSGVPRFSFSRTERRTTCYYFYVWYSLFGAGFIKICAYFPYPVKIWVNGHEWPSGRRCPRGSGSPSCPTGSPPPPTRPRCRPSATGSARPRSQGGAQGAASPRHPAAGIFGVAQ
jgi:hypothetical protein